MAGDRGSCVGCALHAKEMSRVGLHSARSRVDEEVQDRRKCLFVYFNGSLPDSVICRKTVNLSALDSRTVWSATRKAQSA